MLFAGQNHLFGIFTTFSFKNKKKLGEMQNNAKKLLKCVGQCLGAAPKQQYPNTGQLVG